MEEVEPSDFTEYPLEDFWHDMPVPFLITESGSAKTISAPHMVVTLLHHMEIAQNQHIIIIGSKSGYIASLIDNIGGPGGSVTVIEPNEDVIEHTIGCLERVEVQGTIRVLGPESLEDPEWDRDVSRVLITGAVREIPSYLDLLIEDGGFILGPFGGHLNQRLLKREWQGGLWMDTDLGGVVFGPINISDSDKSPFDPMVLAEHLEDIVEMMGGSEGLEGEAVVRLEGLIDSLRGLPEGIPNIDEDSTEEEILEHPVIDLLMSEMEWMGSLWPVIGEMLRFDIANPGSPTDSDSGMLGGHEDLVP
jgi:protein-L-isoaspartate O-methyltransferase|tara:strand:- start:3098 stop:4012 length:915 start_codon:yes stop_codon:yes gene_type:complete